jgi:hypothetical protein
MHQKTLFLIVALLVLLVPGVALAEGESVSSNDLIDHAKDYDGTTVVFEGEVLGDILYRGEFAWLAVFDGSNTIGCYVTRAQAEKIAFVGGYGKRGDTVSVQGEFRRACAEHGGDLDIHASSVTVLSTGARVPMPLSRLVTTLAIALPIPAAILLFLVWKRRAAFRLPKQNSVTNSAQK